MSDYSRRLKATIRHVWQRPFTAATVAISLCLLGPSAWAQTTAQTEISRLLQQGDARQALIQANQAIDADPRDPQLQFLRANAQLALGETQEADATLTALTQSHPELAEPWNNLAVIRAGQGRLDEAQALLARALQSNPDYAQAHANMADVLLRQAISHLQTAQRLVPSPGTAQRLTALEAVGNPAGEQTPPPNAVQTQPIR